MDKFNEALIDHILDAERLARLARDWCSIRAKGDMLRALANKERRKSAMPKINLLPVPEGYKVRIEHFFKPEDLECQCLSHTKKAPRYYTVSGLFDSKGNLVSLGYAACSPRDTPSRKVGRAIAHNRAVRSWQKLHESLAPED
jgi:hypothetical protein